MKFLTALAILSIAAHRNANAQGIDVHLEPAPVANASDVAIEANRIAEPQAEASITIDPQSRASVASLYFSTYLPEDNATNGWSGSIASCIAGATATAFQAATLERINVYRALAGLPGNLVLYTGGTNQSGDQQAALMMVANSALSHAPPPTWKCYTAAGASAAGSSNITLGTNFNYNGPTAIDGYVEDGGGGNEAVGHRRWLLYPPEAKVATGDVDATSGSSGRSSNALWVIGGWGTRAPAPNGIVWPPRGFIPYEMLPSGSNRWSLSIQNADFSHATVSMTRNGAPLAAPKIDPFEYNGQPNGSFIGDNTIVWEPTGVTYTKPAQDVIYHVTVSGIVGSPTSVSYDVTVFDPNTSSDAVFTNGFGG
jgi:uncharacterized protein YkwD